MAMEVTRLREPEIAYLATVGLLPAMDTLVLGKCRGISKGLTAVVTPVWPLPRMGTKVSGHRRTLRKALLADGATEGLLSAVGSKMGR